MLPNASPCWIYKNRSWYPHHHILSYSLGTDRVSKAAPFPGRGCAVQPGAETSQDTHSFQKAQIQNLHTCHVTLPTVQIADTGMYWKCSCWVFKLSTSQTKHWCLTEQHLISIIWQSQNLMCETLIHCGSLSCAHPGNPKFDPSAEGHQKILITGFCYSTGLLN